MYSLYACTKNVASILMYSYVVSTTHLASYVFYTKNLFELQFEYKINCKINFNVHLHGIVNLSQYQFMMNAMW